MNVLTFYIDLDAYIDRVLMLRAAAPALGHVEVLLGQGDAARAAALETPFFKATPLSASPLSRPVREKRLYDAVMQRVGVGEVGDRRLPGGVSEGRQPGGVSVGREPGVGPIHVLHDTATYLLAAFARLRLARRRPVLVSSSFTAAYEWFEDLRRQHPYRSTQYSRLRWTGFLQERATAHLADAVTVFGEGHIGPFARCHGIPASKVHSLPNCCDPAQFAPVPAEEPDGALTGFPAGTRVLLNVGNQFLYKGTWELLRAFAVVSRKHPEARLLLVGAPHAGEAVPFRREVEALGIDGRVRFLGRCPREKIPTLLCSADAFVFPSYTEGSPRAVIEAMACARPIVATALPGITTLDPDGEFIRRVPRADTAALARALDDHLSSTPAECLRRGEAARARFLAHHTPSAAAGPLVELYQRLVAAAGVPVNG